MDKKITYLALLRGINVGGHRPLKMEELRTMFSDMGFDRVRTYIQSGNVIFDSTGEDDVTLANQIAAQIKNTFGYELPVIVKNISSVQKIRSGFPLEQKEGWKCYISFLANRPMPEQAEELESLSGKVEEFRVRDEVVYSAVDKNSDQKPLFSNAFVERKLGMPATTRNLRTVDKIIDMGSGKS